MNDLLAAVLVHRDQRDLAMAGPSTLGPATDAATARARIMRFVTHNLTQREIIRLHHMLSAEALAPAHPAHGYFAKRACEGTEQLRRFLAWKPDPAVAAIELLAFWEGV